MDPTRPFYEVAEDAEIDAPFGAAEAGADDETATGEGAASTEETTPEAPTWAGPSQDEWQQLQEQNAWLAQRLNDVAQPPADDTQADEFADIREAFGLLGIDPERFNQFLGAQVQPYVEPVQPLIEAQRDREVTSTIDAAMSTVEAKYADIFADPATDKPGVTRDDLSYVAAGFFPETRDVGQATEKAAQFVQRIGKQFGDAAVEQYKQSLRGDGTSTPYEPGIHGSGLDIVDEPQTYDQIIDRLRNREAAPHE